MKKYPLSNFTPASSFACLAIYPPEHFMGTVMFKTLISTKFNLCCLKSISWEGRWWFKNREYTQALSFVGSSDDVDRLASTLHRTSPLLVWHFWHLAWHPLWQRSFHLGSEMCAKPKFAQNYISSPLINTIPCPWNTVSRSWEIHAKYKSPSILWNQSASNSDPCQIIISREFLTKRGFHFFCPQRVNVPFTLHSKFYLKNGMNAWNDKNIK